MGLGFLRVSSLQVKNEHRQMAHFSEAQSAIIDPKQGLFLLQLP